MNTCFRIVYNNVGFHTSNHRVHFMSMCFETNLRFCFGLLLILQEEKCNVYALLMIQYIDIRCLFILSAYHGELMMRFWTARYEVSKNIALKKKVVLAKRPQHYSVLYHSDSVTRWIPKSCNSQMCKMM